MSSVDTERAIERVIGKRTELGVEDFSAYAVLVLGLLAGQAPEVVEFIFDRADAMVEGQLDDLADAMVAP